MRTTLAGVAWIFAFAWLSSAAALAQTTDQVLIDRAHQLGVEAAERAQADRTNAETIIADKYRQVLALSTDETVKPRLKEAFRRGYEVRLAGPTPPPPAPQKGPRLFDVTAARGVAWGRPVGSAGVITPDTNPIYVWFRHEGIAAGTTVTSVWYYLDTATPTRITEGSIIVQPPADWGEFSFELAPGKLWPDGAYRVELLVAGNPVAEARFKVATSRPGALPVESRPYVHPRVGFQFLAPPGWKLDDRVSHADVQLKPEQGEGLIEITSGPASIKLDPVSYAAGWESSTVGPGKLLQSKQAGRSLSVDGEGAYEGIYEGAGVLAKVLFVSTIDRFFVLTAVFQRADFQHGASLFDRIVQSFRLRRAPQPRQP